MILHFWQTAHNLARWFSYRVGNFAQYAHERATQANLAEINRKRRNP